MSKKISNRGFFLNPLFTDIVHMSHRLSARVWLGGGPRGQRFCFFLLRFRGLFVFLSFDCLKERKYNK